ncbi:hypothetical protein AURDEDRAFT_109633 [Auricularia subglabra TFB-10046 SS5]|nr:hypothetical protein AURDEDRAFT_109633 [Auricularia subglabra TFB-10046 SS5]
MSDTESESESNHDRAGSIRDRLEMALDDLDADENGSFAFRRTYTDAPNPTLSLAGLGRVGLPLGEKQARDVIAYCDQAPFGMGERTVVDKDVRDTWEMDASKVAFDHPAWNGFIARVATDVCEALGVDETLSKPRCELYKLLVYEKGSHFLPHVDTEKASNMFATVVIVLPTEFTGGDAHVSHCGRAMVLNTSQASLTNTTVLAWYTDVLHEVKPVASGVRLALTYNLVHTTERILPSLPDYSGEMEQLREVLRDWNSKTEAGDGVPDRIVLQLEHKYSRANLSARALKGPDARKVALLDEVARHIGLGMGLANFRHVMSGQADDPHGMYSTRGRDNSLGFADKHDMDYNSYTENLVDLEGHLLRAKEMNFNEDQNTIPFQFVRNLRYEEGDEQKYHGYMGNGAGTLERFYRMSVLVLWPKWSELAQLGGNRRAADCLERLAASHDTGPAPDDEEAFEYVLQSTRKDSLSTLCTVARRWTRPDLWRSAMLKFGADDCTKEIIAGVEILGFDALQSTIAEFIRTLSSNAARFRPIEGLRAWAAGGTSVEQAAVDTFTQELVPWLLEDLKPPVKPEMEVLTSEALIYGGAHAVEILLVPRILTVGDLGFMQHYAMFLAHDAAKYVAGPDEDAALGRAIDKLLCEIADRADFFPIPKPRFTYMVNPRPPDSHKPAFAFLRACLDQRRTSIAARGIRRMLDIVAACPPELAASRALVVLLPLIPCLSSYLRANSPLVTELPLDELGWKTIELVLNSDDAKKGELIATDVSAMMDATAIGETHKLFSRLALMLGHLPWKDSFARICIETICSRRSEPAFSSILPAHFDAVIQGMTANFARQVDYVSYNSDRLHALFNFCLDAGGLACLTIVLDRAVDTEHLVPVYVDTTLLRMITPLCHTARDRRLSLGSEPFARILCVIMRTWVDKCLGPRPDEARTQNLLSTLSRYTCACTDCTPVRKFLNNHETPPTGWAGDECYLRHIGADRYNHVVGELTEWAAQIATWEPCRSGRKGIRVRFNEVLPSRRRWKETQARGILALRSVGDASELTAIFGPLYSALADALHTSDS